MTSLLHENMGRALQFDLLQRKLSWGGFTVQIQTFVDVVETNLFLGSMSGILGLAWPGVVSTGPATKPFWLTVSDAGEMDTKEFGVYLARSTSEADEDANGDVFILRSVNETIYTGNIEFLHLTTYPGFTGGKTLWQLDIANLNVNGKSINIPTGKPSFIAAIDTGTSFIGGASSFIKEFYALIPNSKHLSDLTLQGFYRFPCKSQLDVSIKFAGGTEA
ncbi:aspartic peptidase domain-containing protein [Flagelloscypha sp. PMI_526]|nr:aspartic peptidase domain-containing protein [Flagelloscypha sp. PMI_526]